MYIDLYQFKFRVFTYTAVFFLLNFILLTSKDLGAKDAEPSQKDIRLIRELNRMEYSVASLQEKLDILNSSIKLQEQVVNDFNAQINIQTRKLSSKKRDMNKRIAELIKYSVPERLNFLVLSSNFDSAARAEALISFILKRDIADYRTAEKGLASLEKLKTFIEEEKQKLEDSRRDYDSSLEELKVARDRKKSLLEKVKDSDQAYKVLVNRLEKGREKMSYFMEGGKFVKHALSEEYRKIFDNMIAPIKGKLISSFGRVWDQRIRNWTYNKGVTLACEYGKEVRAVDAGSVSFSGWILGYGRVLILSHKNDVFSVYAHLSRVVFNTGDIVSKGAVIAYTGDTGSVENPALYFELRQGRNNIDPRPLFY
jgi:septal ring factor EnvC (AmiA/AmiB activator)